MNPNQRQRLLTVVAASMIAIWLGDRLLLTPLLRAWRTRAENLAQLRERVAKGESMLDREQALRSRWETMQTNALSGEVSAAVTQMLKAFERWTRDSGVSVSGIRPQWKRNPEDFLTLECHAEAAGNLSALTRFLYLIEKDPLAVRVDSLDLSSKRDKEGQQLSLVLQVSSLFLGQATP